MAAFHILHLPLAVALIRNKFGEQDCTTKIFETQHGLTKAKKPVSKKNEDDSHVQDLGNKKGTITSFVLSDYVWSRQEPLEKEEELWI